LDSCLKKFLAVEQLATFETGALPNVSCVVLLFIGLYDELTDAVKNNLLFSTKWRDFILWFDLLATNDLMHLILNASDL
jgi:hypothetical protein